MEILVKLCGPNGSTVSILAYQGVQHCWKEHRIIILNFGYNVFNLHGKEVYICITIVLSKRFERLNQRFETMVNFEQICNCQYHLLSFVSKWQDVKILYWFSKFPWQSFNRFWLSCLGSLIFMIPNTLELFGFPILWHWAYLMKTIPETCQVYKNWYLRFFKQLHFE